MIDGFFFAIGLIIGVVVCYISISIAVAAIEWIIGRL